MQINFTGDNIEITDALRQLVEKNSIISKTITIIKSPVRALF